MDDFSSMRYAHSDGHTDLCYDQSGNYLITCGTDGDIRVWNGFEDDDPTSHHIGESVSAIAFKENMVYLSSDTYAVLAYTFPKAEFEGIIAQFTSSVFHIACSKDGRFVAAGGGDFIVKIYDTANKSLSAFRGHDGPILSIALDPKGKFMASASCDGTVRLWQMSDQVCHKKLTILKKCSGFRTSETMCNIDWSSDGQLLAIPVEKEIKFYQKDTWDCSFTISDPSILQNLNIVIFSPCGKFIAASTGNGQMFVWDVKKSKCVSKKTHEKKLAVCSLAWNPNGKEIAFCDDMGQLGIYENATSQSEKIQVAVDQDGSELVDFECMEDNMEEDDDDDDNDNAFDIGAIKATLEPKIFGTNDEDSMSVKSVIGVGATEEKCRIVEAPKAPVQTAFQPSSTPVSLERRFMLWNSIGIVRSYNTEEENSIDVEFHDTNVYHPLHLNNTRGHTMAALSAEALLLACPKMDENSSKLECMHFGTWDSNKEWIIEMPESEEIECIALGSGWAVAITDKKFVRIFTVSGVQTEIFTIPGSVVCSATSNDQLAIAYHKGSGIDNNQCLGLLIVKIKLSSQTIIKDYTLPLNSKSFLNWLGYSDEEHPCIVDTAGTVSLLNVSCGGKWIPIADTKAHLKGKSDSYFIIGLSEIKQEIRCILCKGSRYPALLPRPTVTVITFSLPFCEMSSDKGRFEEENQRYALLHSCLKVLMDEGFDVETEYNSAEKKRMEMLLKMFALATRTEREYRALDIAELMPNQKVVQGAIKYATQRHSIALAERLGEVMRRKIEAELNYDQQSLIDEDEPVAEISYRKSIGLASSSTKEEVLLHPKPLSRLSSCSTSKYINGDESITADMESAPDSASENNYSLIPKTVNKINPFKTSSKAKQESPKTSSADIDSMLRNTTVNLASKPCSAPSSEKKQSKQSRLFARHRENAKKKTSVQNGTEKVISGFPLFLEENKGKITLEHADLDEKDVLKMAMKLYKELPEDEKKKYLHPLTEHKTSSVNGISDTNSSNHTTTEEDLEETTESASASDTNKPSEESSSKRKIDSEKDQSSSDSKSESKRPKMGKEKLSSNTVAKLTQFAFTKMPKKQ